MDKAGNFLPSVNQIKFLDIGAGERKTLIEAVNRGWETTGIDIVDNRVDKDESSRVNFIKGKFLEYDFPENHFDFIYMDSVLEHVLEPLGYFTKAEKILKPGVILYIGVPNEDSLFNYIMRAAFKLVGKGNFSEKLKPFDTPYHVVGFNFHSLKYLIRLAGMKTKYIRSFGRKFDFLSFPPYKKGFWISLIFLFPMEIVGYLVNRDVYLRAYLSK